MNDGEPDPGLGLSNILRPNRALHTFVEFDRTWGAHNNELHNAADRARTGVPWEENERRCAARARLEAFMWRRSVRAFGIGGRAPGSAVLVGASG